MGDVGLLYVGAALVLNGLVLLGRVDARAAVPLNLFVGTLQVIVPTYLIMTAEGPDAILAASGTYLFGFTYLYVALDHLMELDGTGLGWFSLFIAGCALVFAFLQLTRFGDPAFAVIWLQWAFLWTLFFVVLGLGHERLARYTGAVAIVQGVTTATIPAFLRLTGTWDQLQVPAALVLGVGGLVVFTALYPRLTHDAGRTLVRGISAHDG